MAGPARRVFPGLDGTGADQGWVFVIVAAPTGVVHEVQGGGFGCVPYAQEGYLLPVFGRGLDEELGDADGPGALVRENCDRPDQARRPDRKGSTGFPLALAVDWSTRVSSVLAENPLSLQ
jgi:hypothetical protein